MNKHVAVTPFETTQTKTQVRGGIAVIRQRADLTPLRVVYPYDDFVGGFHVTTSDVLYFRGDMCKFPTAKDIYEVEPGKPFILLPVDQVMAMKSAWEDAEDAEGAEFAAVSEYPSDESQR